MLVAKGCMHITAFVHAGENGVCFRCNPKPISSISPEERARVDLADEALQRIERRVFQFSDALSELTYTDENIGLWRDDVLEEEGAPLNYMELRAEIWRVMESTFETTNTRLYYEKPLLQCEKPLSLHNVRYMREHGLTPHVYGLQANMWGFAEPGAIRWHRLNSSPSSAVHWRHVDARAENMWDYLGTVQSYLRGEFWWDGFESSLFANGEIVFVNKWRVTQLAPLPDTSDAWLSRLRLERVQEELASPIAVAAQVSASIPEIKLERAIHRALNFSRA